MFQHMRKKGKVTGVLLTSILLTLLIGQIGGAEGKVVVNYWHGHTGPDGKVMAALADEFEKRNPNVDIEISVYPWGQLFTKTQLAIASGGGPDFVTMGFDRMPVWKDMLFKPIDDILGKTLTKDRFDPALWETPVLNGKRYGIPLDTHPYLVYYRPDLMEKAGLAPPPKDRPLKKDEFITYLRKLRMDGQYGFAFKGRAHHVLWDFWGLFLQFGGKLYNEDKTKLLINEKPGIKALEFLLDLKKDNLVPPEILDWKTIFTRFERGEIAMQMHGSWLIPALRQAGYPWETAMTPWIGDKVYASWANLHTFGFTRLPGREEQTKIGMQFAEWIEQADNATKWGVGSGNVPALLSARENYGKYEKLKPIAALAEQMKGQFFMQPYHPKGETLQYKIIIPGLEAIHAGEIGVKEGLDKIVERANKLLQE